ncbi:AAA ATPase midasin [Coemansia sp. Benny D115]|nr:AAA ATPase midasin [Coemansia sp. Benny D115]
MVPAADSGKRRPTNPVDTVEKSLEKLDLATQSTEENALSQQQQHLGTDAQHSLEECIEITEIDPLSIDLPSAIRHLADQIDVRAIAVPKAAHQILHALKQWAKSSPTPNAAAAEKTLNRISALLLAEGLLDEQNSILATQINNAGALWSDGQFTLTVASVFRPILVELVARWTLPEAPALVFHHLGARADAECVHACVAYAAGVICGTAPQVRSLVLAFFQHHATQECLASIGARHSAQVHYLAVALRLLRRMPETIVGVGRWDWTTALTQIMAPGSNATDVARLLACECLCIVRGLTDSGRQQLMGSLGADPLAVAGVRAWSVYGEQQFDGQAQRQTAEQNRKGFAGQLYSRENSGAEHPWLPDSVLSSCVANVGGVLLHAHALASRPTGSGNVVLTPTVTRNVHEIALATSRREPVLLHGPVGSGKTSLVEWVARSTGHQLVTIHLSSSMDAKVLLGNYVTTQRAGDFEWQAGLLTTAVAEGQWVLVEDIDLAPPDVVQTLVPLLESHTLFVASRGETIRAHMRFRLFATLSTHARGSGMRGPGTDGLLGSSIWTRLEIGSLEAEMPLIIAGVFPALASHAQVLAQAFARISEVVGGGAHGAISSVRQGQTLSTRDLIKWCTRLQAHGANDSFQLFQEAVDAFAMREEDYGRWRTLIHRIGAVFGIARQRIDNFADQYAPDTTRTGSELRIGRAVLPVASSNVLEERMPFASTRHAKCLLERIAACVQLAEPVLLAGETGTGKTTVVQHLAALAGRPLAVFNLSQQSDSSDLLGGFRPVDVGLVALRLRESFDALFSRTFSVRKNAAFLDSVRVAHAKRDWRRLSGIFRAAVKMADQVIQKAQAQAQIQAQAQAQSTAGSGTQGQAEGQEKQPKRQRLLDSEDITALAAEWTRFSTRAEDFEGLRGARMVFSFVEGALVTAARTGGWILLDEVNLATAETLACLGGLLQSERSLLLAETGERIPCHQGFRLFGCMNPSNDVGKRDLPPGLRSSFTEFFVHPPDSSADDLLAIVQKHLPPNAPPQLCHRIIDFYRRAKQLALEHRLVDGANQRPHYSLRTLTRSLTYARENAAAYSLKRSLYDGLCMTFVTQLESKTQDVLLRELAQVFENDNLRQMLGQAPQARTADSVLVQGFWLPTMSDNSLDDSDGYVLTASVETKIRALARAVMCGRYPVLIQGPTSAGKTSMVQHLARLTGHKFVRINNHEHTDLQEYLGSYTSQDGKLVFEEGLLVKALRHGHWLVLDELNLAPSDVLEALNRLLDDNRELVIPETQEIVRPHPHFMLFATQNPAGLYGGRKALSRAFRNRFVELHFDDIPEQELQRIIVDSCQVPPTHAQLLVQVYRNLTQVRAQTRIFEASHGFITLRDLFRWANRHAGTKSELAEHGYMLIAERVRTEDEKAVVKRAIEGAFYKKSGDADRDSAVRRHEGVSTGIDAEALYSEERLRAMPEYQSLERQTGGACQAIAWTKAMRRLFILTALCLRFNEPVLLVGETGCGKTTVCQMLAQAHGQQLHVVNCHQNTESSDILGGQRPVRNRLELIAAARDSLRALGEPFVDGVIAQIDTPEHLDTLVSQLSKEYEQVNADIEAIRTARELLVRAQDLFAWYDGPLVQAMKQGDVFLMDELNLADDSVLERLNSVLEPSRTLVLAEQSGASSLTAAPAFKFAATMNPGGDYGKRELSPALRNRFTELWAPTTTDVDDLQMILATRLKGVPRAEWCAEAILNFVAYLRDTAKVLLHPLSLRDYLFWADFINKTHAQIGDVGASLVHGACLVLLDSIGTQGSIFSLSARLPAAVKAECISRLREMANWGTQSTATSGLLGVVPARTLAADAVDSNGTPLDLTSLISREQGLVGVAPFFVSAGQEPNTSAGGFALHAPTTFDNLVKVLRAMQVGKPLLLEGSPGVGKTTLVSTLARISGHRLVRINLSDQTDLMDLFGTDLPVEDGFAWCDAPFLQALKQGDWVLLDEINLASQSVLEGLNSCLDHRGTVYISELDREFTLSPGFRLFAAQNPLGQGGGRKGLPRSFVNRFTQVYMDELERSDLQIICQNIYGGHSGIDGVLEFNWRMHSETMGRRSFGSSGAPWEFNLRDVSRFMDLALQASPLEQGAKPIEEFIDMLYVQRMRTEHDRQQVRRLYAEVFRGAQLSTLRPSMQMTERTLQVGNAVLERRPQNAAMASSSASRLRVLHSQLPYLESLMKCIEMRWMAILVGAAGSGKTSLVRWLANATGNRLVEFSMNAGVDTSEILGGFEQVDQQRHRTALVNLMEQVVAQATLLVQFQSPEQSDVLARMCAIHHQSSATEQQHGQSTCRPDICALAGELASLASQFAQLQELSETLRQRAAAFAQLEVAGKFEWVDGILVEALINGYWLLVDRANLCSASVLDRLNGLLEPNGVLYVNEDPKRTEAIVPHSNFRIIMAVDPHYGELSRAMRNRGIEICVLPPAPEVTEDATLNVSANDQRVVAAAIGVSQELLGSTDFRPEPTITALVQQAMHITERVQRGYVVETVDNDKLPTGCQQQLVRAPDSASNVSIFAAAWYAALAQLSTSAFSVPSAAIGTSLWQRMLLAALSTLPPSSHAQSTLCLQIVLSSLSAQPTLSLMKKLLAGDSPALIAALNRAREMLSSESRIHAGVLEAAPLLVALNGSLYRSLKRQDAEGAAALWHQALVDSLLFHRERLIIDTITAASPDMGSDGADVRELVLQRPNVDIGFVQSVFDLIDGCQLIIDAWEPTLVNADEPTVRMNLSQFVPALKYVYLLKQRVQQLLLVHEHSGVAASELAVAFEHLQAHLARLAVVPGPIGKTASELLQSTVNGLVLDASYSAKMWAREHPVTLATDESRVLEQRLIKVVENLQQTSDGSLDANSSNSGSLRGSVTEALAMLYATASRKDQHLVLAAIARFADGLPGATESIESAPSAHLQQRQQKQQEQNSAPADVISNVDELSTWRNIIQLTSIVSALGSAPSSAVYKHQLQGLVRSVSVSETSAWALLFTRLNWTLNESGVSNIASGSLNNGLLPLLTDLGHKWYRFLENHSYGSLLSAADQRLWQPVATELVWKQASQFDCALADYETSARESRDLLRSLALYRPYTCTVSDELVALVVRATQAVRSVSDNTDACSALTLCSAAMIDALRALSNKDRDAVIPRSMAAEWTELVLRALPRTLAGSQFASAVECVQAALVLGTFEVAYRACVELSIGVLAMSVPGRPVDPAAKARTQWTWLGDEITTAQADLESYKAIQQTMTSDSATPATQPFALRLAELERQQAAIELVYRPASKDVHRGDATFAELWQEAHNLSLNVLGRVRDAVNQLVRIDKDFGRVHETAKTLLTTLGQFEDRVVRRYFPAFRDMAQIWCTQVRHVGYGLARLVELRHRQVNSLGVKQADMICSLYKQPMTSEVDGSRQSVAAIQSKLAQLKNLIYFTPGSNALKTYGQLLVALLSRIVIEIQVRGSIDYADFDTLDAVVYDAYQIHKRARAEQRKNENEKASLFKYKAPKEQTDEELLSEIFPGYEDVYEASPADEDADKTAEPSYQDLSDETVAALAACHQYVMLQFGGVSQHQGAADIRHAQIADAQSQAFELAASLYGLKPELLALQKAGADAGLRGANLVALAAVASATTMTATTGQSETGLRVVKVYNFYKDSSTGEAVLLKPLISKIIKRTTFLLEEWPEHAVLEQIRDMCKRLLQLAMTTPLAKLLTGLELLYQRAQDWQAYASKEVSIDELAEVARLIIRWRQAELNSWPHLLQAQELEFARRPSEWWFNLYASLAVTPEDDGSGYNDLISAVDQFMQGSPAGEFRGRLNMLYAFAAHRSALLSARVLKGQQSRKESGESLAELQQTDPVYGPLINAIDYYVQYAPCIAEHLERANKSIKKDLSQYVKISMWKDVNPAALQASAQKTHRHLAKCVKQWRLALSQPIFQIIQVSQTAAIATAKVPSIQIVPLPLSNAGFDVAQAKTIAALCAGKGLSLPWSLTSGSSADCDISADKAGLVARLASSAAVVRVLESSPATAQQMAKLMVRSPMFSQSHTKSGTSPDALEEFALQIVSDVNYFQNVETPKHLVKRPSKSTGSEASAKQTSSKKKIIKSKKQKAEEAEKVEEYIEDDEERQKRIKQFWGEQRNLRRTRFKEILKGLQEIGLKRYFRPVEEDGAASEGSKSSSGLKGFAAVMKQAPLDVAQWHQAAAAMAVLSPAAVHEGLPRAHRNWQLAGAGFFKLCSQMAQLRTSIYEEHSQEVSAQQIQHIVGLMESLNHNVLKDRACAAEMLSHSTSWMRASVGWGADIGSSEAHPDDAQSSSCSSPVGELKRAADSLSSLIAQFLVSARAVDDAGGWGDNAVAVGNAVAIMSTASSQLTQATMALSAVNAGYVSLQLSGLSASDSAAHVSDLDRTLAAQRAVGLAADSVCQALADITALPLDGWVLGPWTEPMGAAAERLCSLFEPAGDEEMAEPEKNEQVTELADLAGQWVTAVMNVWQAIDRAEKQHGEHDAEPNMWGLSSKELVHRMELIQRLVRALHLPAMLGLCQRLTQQQAACGDSSESRTVRGFARFWIMRYSLVVQHVAAMYAEWHRTLVQFALTACGVLTTVVVHGLGTTDVHDSEETQESSHSGTGMGEGSTAGAKNVSDEIEGEDQVEGLQGEQPEDGNEPDTNEDAIDMENDFDGATGDADLESDNDDSDGDSDEEPEMDEQLGDVDPTDPTAIDEKLWDDDEEQKQSDKADDSKVDSKAKDTKEQSDIVAGDDADDDTKNDGEPGEQAEQEEGSEHSDSEGEGEGSDDDLGDGVNQDTLDRMADVEDQDEQMELPDDLDMGSGEEDEGSGEDDDGLDADMNDLPEDEPIEQRPDAMDEENAEEAPDEPTDDAIEGAQADERAEDQDGEAEDEEEAADGASVDGENDSADEQNEAGDDEGDEEGKEEDGEDEEDGGRAEEDAARAEDAEEAGANKPTDGIDSAMNLDGNDDTDPNTAAESNDAVSKPSDSTQSNAQQQPASSSAQQQQAQQQPDDQKRAQEQPDDQQQPRRNLNPERTLADVIEKWERRLNLTMREEEEKEKEKESEHQEQLDDAAAPESADAQNEEPAEQAAPESTEFEHVAEDEHFDKVALADADENDVEQQQQQQHQPMDIDEESDAQPENEDDDADMQDAPDAQAAASAAARPAAPQPAAPQQLPEAHRDGESAADGAQMQTSTAEDALAEQDDEQDASPTPDADEDNVPVVDVERLREELEQATAEWRANKQDAEQAMHLWQAYTRLTHDLSLMLTEQLRLILTPTQATQLRGDYRTGKRLNMKRIIPYIASEFRKDKIWLRRTKPARREYQVMVALDNSKSMAQSPQAVELAYETLALVTTALNQLEVGQLSVVSFGEQVSLLHPFDSPFDSEAGARVLSRLPFADDRTDVVQLMDASLQLFDSAAMHSSSAGDLWRLQLVISDGVCQDHPRLLRQVRAAMEMRIMTVFIVLDRSAIATATSAKDIDPEKDSIMNTQHVSFVKGPDGRMEMKVERYLDTFPFKYYVVLRNIHHLPAVLAETLRQYFSLVGSE